MWFDSWSDVFRTILVGTAAYAILVIVLRITGKRTLSQLNTFDFVVTVALGSTLATILLSSEVSWSEGFTAFVVLAGLQFIVALLSTRWPRIRSGVTGRAVLLLEDGQYRDDAIRSARLTRSDVLQAIRSTGTGEVKSVAAVVLETNGKLSVIEASYLGDGSALQGVRAA
jgi:uncharacterized membrane protein YcaP (DUF421 family)